MIQIGFTGSQKGPTDAQFAAFAWLMLTFLKLESVPFEFNHGDCIGWDEAAHNWVTAQFPFHVRTVAHPGHTRLGEEGQIKRAFCKADEVMESMPCLGRNIVIAARARYCLIACPATNQETLRSGTWHTVRAAAKLNGATSVDTYKDRPIYIVRPDGKVMPWAGTELDAHKISHMGPQERTLFAL